MPSTANVGITLLTTGVCTGGHESLWTTSTVLAVLAVLVSVVSMGFSLWSWYREHLRRLVLDQTGNSMTDLILETTNAGPTTYQLNVVVINASLTTTIVIRSFCLKLPWDDEFLKLLDDPRLLVPQRDDYKFPCTEMHYPRTSVINHKRNADGVLRPGGTIQGLLRAYSPKLVPQEYRDQKDVRVQFWVTDETGKTYRNDAFEMRISLARE